jgi:hypothetical protein
MSESTPNVSTELLARERTLLSPLRRKHAEELMSSGMLARLFSSHTGQNVLVEPLRQGEELQPYRTAASVKTIRGVLARTRQFLPPVSEFNDSQPSYALLIHRSPQLAGTYRPKSYFVGDVVSEPLAKQLKLGQHIAGIGMQWQDVELVAAQLAEVESAINQHGLTTIDPVSLLESVAISTIRKPTLP